MTDQSQRRCSACGTPIAADAPPDGPCPTCGRRFDEPAHEPRRHLSGPQLLALALSASALGLAIGALLLLWRQGLLGPSSADAHSVPSRLASLEAQVNHVQEQVRSASEALHTESDRTADALETVQQMRRRLSEAEQVIERLSAGLPLWIEYPDNPVFTRDGPIAFPSVLYDADQFAEGPDGPFYKIWYDQCDDGVNVNSDLCRIGLAISQDGIHWKDLGDVQRTDGQAFEQTMHPCVLYDVHGFAGSHPPYRMYYRDVGRHPLRMAESDDGVLWQSHNDFALHGDAVLPKDAGTLHGMSVTYDDGGTPADARDDRFTAWLDHESRPVLLTSADGIRWQLPGTLLFDGSTRSEDPALTMTTSALSVVSAPGGLYHIFFSYGDSTFNGPAPAGEAIACCTARLLARQSLPLRNTTPLFHCRDPVPWRAQVTMAPCVIYDPDAFSGNGDHVYCKMWFHGVAADGKSGIGYATLRGELKP